MQNPIPKLRQTSVISEKPWFCLKNWKLWRTPTTIEFNIFLLEFCTRFLLSNICKRVCAIFFIFFRSWVINKSVKNKFVETRSFIIFANNSKCSKILNCRVVGVCQSFQIFRQNTWFLENNRALSKFLYGILHYLISIIKL